MLKNYLIVIFRNFARNRLYGTINTLGMALGYATFMLVTIYLLYETSFEDFHKKSGRIYRPTYSFDSGNGYHVHWARIPVDYINELPDEFPEVERLVRFQNHERKYVRVGEHKFKPKHAYVTDYEIFDVFDLPLVSGNPKTALKEPYSIVLTESLAKKYFGQTDVLGKDVYVLGDWNTAETRHEVTGIMYDIPSNTHLPIDMLISFQNEEERSGWAYVYVLLRQGTNIDHVNSGILEFIKKYADENSVSKVDFEFQPLNDIHLHSDLAREIVPNGNILYIKIFAVIDFFILLIALANFINLSSALHIGRSKEFGLRRVFGAENRQMAFYSISESVVFHLIAMMIGGILAFLIFPYFGMLTAINPIIYPVWMVIGMIALALFCGVLAGISIIFHMHAMHPSDILKSNKTIGMANKGRTINVKRILVSMQFCISILLIGSAFIAMDQFNYLNEKNLGISTERILAIPDIPDRVKDDFVVFKDRLKTIPGVKEVAGCMQVPSSAIRDAGPVLVKGMNEDPDKAPVMDIQIIDHAYLDLLDIELIAGENIPQSLAFEAVPVFTEDYTYQDYLLEKRRAYLINETAMKQLGWQTAEEAIGQQISWSIGSIQLASGPVCGIVKDYHQESLKNKIDPTIMIFEPLWLRTFLVKVETGNVPATIAGVKSIWDDLFPSYPMGYHFLDDMYEALYKNDRIKLQLLYALCALAIIIAFIGLFGLIAYSLKTRVKEIAIRKVLGADLLVLIRIISREYVLILALAAIFAIPISYYYVDQWLQHFAYKTEISGLSYVFTLLLITFLVLVTVSLQIVKISFINPADTLRDE